MKLKQRLPIANQREFAEKVGITKEYLSEIQNGKNCGKTTAFAITKMFDNELEIADLFEEV